MAALWASSPRLTTPSEPIANGLCGNSAPSAASLAVGLRCGLVAVLRHICLHRFGQVLKKALALRCTRAFVRWRVAACNEQWSQGILAARSRASADLQGLHEKHASEAAQLRRSWRSERDAILGRLSFEDGQDAALPDDDLRRLQTLDRKHRVLLADADVRQSQEAELLTTAWHDRLRENDATRRAGATRLLQDFASSHAKAQRGLSWPSLDLDVAFLQWAFTQRPDVWAVAYPPVENLYQAVALEEQRCSLTGVLQLLFECGEELPAVAQLAAWPSQVWVGRSRESKLLATRLIKSLLRRAQQRTLRSAFTDINTAPVHFKPLSIFVNGSFRCSETGRPDPLPSTFQRRAEARQRLSALAATAAMGDLGSISMRPSGLQVKDEPQHVPSGKSMACTPKSAAGESAAGEAGTQKMVPLGESPDPWSWSSAALGSSIQVDDGPFVLDTNHDCIEDAAQQLHAKAGLFVGQRVGRPSFAAPDGRCWLSQRNTPVPMLPALTSTAGHESTVPSSESRSHRHSEQAERPSPLPVTDVSTLGQQAEGGEAQNLSDSKGSKGVVPEGTPNNAVDLFFLGNRSSEANGGNQQATTGCSSSRSSLAESSRRHRLSTSDAGQPYQLQDGIFERQHQADSDESLAAGCVSASQSKGDGRPSRADAGQSSRQRHSSATHSDRLSSLKSTPRVTPRRSSSAIADASALASEARSTELSAAKLSGLSDRIVLQMSDVQNLKAGVRQENETAGTQQDGPRSQQREEQRFAVADTAAGRFSASSAASAASWLPTSRESNLDNSARCDTKKTLSSTDSSGSSSSRSLDLAPAGKTAVASVSGLLSNDSGAAASSLDTSTSEKCPGGGRVAGTSGLQSDLAHTMQEMPQHQQQ